MCAPTVSFDIDGVLSHFIRGFTRIGYRMFGTPVVDTQSSWGFEKSPELQLNALQCDLIWGEIFKSPSFWTYLDPLNQSVMYQINRYTNRIFITTRMGVHVHQQSVKFLERWWIAKPLVYVAKDKVSIAKARSVVAHIDDYYPNCSAIKRALPNTYVAMLYHPYNAEHQEACHQEGVDVVFSVDQYCTAVETKGLVTYDDTNV